MTKGRENKDVIELCRKLRKTKKGIWLKVAELLLCPSRNSISVNVSKIDENAKENETIIIPGKVLGAGKISRKLTVAALSFSKGTKERIEKAGGKCVSIDAALSANPKGTNLRIFR